MQRKPIRAAGRAPETARLELLAVWDCRYQISTGQDGAGEVPGLNAGLGETLRRRQAKEGWSHLNAGKPCPTGATQLSDWRGAVPLARHLRARLRGFV